MPEDIANPKQKPFDVAGLERIFAHLDQETLPGAAVGVALNGAVIFRRGFGLASAELQTPLSPTMRMRIGSATKQFTALAYMLLCEDGLATPNDAVGRHLDGFPASVADTTIQQLMQNVSGLRDTCALKLDFAGIETSPIGAEQLVSPYHTVQDHNAPAQTKWIYNNGGWLLVSAVIEKIDGKPLEEILRSRIFSKIGMNDTVLRRWDSSILPNAASNHMRLSTGEFMRADYGMENFSGGGAIASTVDDMLAWLSHMNAPTVGNSDTWAAMKRSGQLANGTFTDYGLGLFVNRYRSLPVIHHAGGGIGCNAQIIKVPQAGLDIVVMANRDDVSSSDFANKIIDEYLGGPPPEVATSTPPLNATYRSRSTGQTVHFFELGGKQIASVDGQDMSLTPDGDDLIPADQWRHLQFRFHDLHRRTSADPIAVSEFGSVVNFFRAHSHTQAQSIEITGSFYAPSIGVAADIHITPSRALLTTKSQFGIAKFELRPIALNIWRAYSLGIRKLYGGILAFEDADSGFYFSNYHNRRILFGTRS